VTAPCASRAPMFDAPVAEPANFEAWRRLARAGLAAEVPPEGIAWRAPDGLRDLHATEVFPEPVAAGRRVPAALVDLARDVICHRSPERFALLYRLLWRITHGERPLLEIAVDPDVRLAQRMAKAVRRDSHKMKAFVRFRKVKDRLPEQFVAWFEPEHHIVEATAPFFQRRFAAMRWSILTPLRSVHWTGEVPHFAPGTTRACAPADDALEDLWRTYYAHIFNPARLRVQAMRAEMPMKYWRNMPETTLIRPLIRGARARTVSMIGAEPGPGPANAERWTAVPTGSPSQLSGIGRFKEELGACERCPLHALATQAVRGEGPVPAPLMLVGEQPGDEEDLAGRPFVGPAGRLLDDLLRAGGIERERAYLTNAVKHFRFTPRGKRRMHQRPDSGHIEHCRPWLERELDLVRPEVVVALGATAAEALLRRPVRLAELRGQPLPYGPATLIVTYHPSYALRLPDPARRTEARAQLIEDLRAARALLQTDAGASSGRRIPACSGRA
jgi:probable DNA metabolism protein